MNQLKGYKIIVRGDHPQHTPDFDFIAKHNNIIPVTPLEHGLAMLMLQHADFVLATDFAASALILRNQRYKKAITKLDLLLATDDSTQIYLGVSRFSNVPESLLKRIKVSVNKMRDSGQIEQILFSPASQ